MNARIIIADDHLVVREGLRRILESEPGVQVVAEAEDGIAAEEAARSVAADLLILDIGLPLRRGLTVCERLRADNVMIPILFFTMYPQAQYSAAVRKLGAQGFVSKETPGPAIRAAVDKVLSGGTAFTSAVSTRKTPTSSDDPLACLSKREMEVLRGLVDGMSLTNLSRQMGIGAKSVSTYRMRLLTKLGKSSNAELIALVVRQQH